MMVQYRNHTQGSYDFFQANVAQKLFICVAINLKHFQSEYDTLWMYRTRRFSILV